MRRLAVITLISVASLPLGGCNLFNGLFNRGQDAGTEPTAQQPVPAQSGDQVQEEFAEPMVPAAPSAAAIASAELIQSTDPNERLQQIAKSRLDPYATVPIPPPPKAAPPPARPNQGQNQQPQGGTGTATTPGGGNTTGQPVAIRPGGGVNNGRGPATSGAGAGSRTGAGNAGPGRTSTGNPSVVSPIQPLPPLPQPQVASAVAVTGVVRVGGETYAIIQAPGEPTSRYVRAGQRLANGQVLVKRIEARGGTEPIVILEENGIEVSRPVGSSGGPVEEGPMASANIPPSAGQPLNVPSF
ncbi:MAG TPA: hypothetical protein V6D29_02165 [Leptolyngbyaceae cyanobacterium]